MFHQHRRRGMRNVLALLVLAHALCAQKPEWWVHQALRQNPTLAALQARWQAASQRIVPGMTPADPMLMLGVANFPPGASLRSEPMGMLMLGLGQMLAWPTIYTLRGEEASAEARSIQLQQHAYERWLRQQVLSTLAQLWETRRQQEFLRYTLELLARADSLVAQRIAVGAASQRDFFRLQLERSRLQADFLAERERERSLHASFLQLVGDESADSSWEPVLPSIPDAIAPLPVLEQRLRSHPILEAARADSLRAAAAVQLARLWFLPEVTVKLQYAYRPAPMAPATTGTSLVSAGIELGLPLFSSRRQLPAVDERSWQLEERRAELAARLLELHALLRQTYARWESLRDRERLYRTQLLPQAEALLDATLAPYQTGQADVDALLAAYLELYQSHREWLRLRAELAQTVASLEALSIM